MNPMECRTGEEFTLPENTFKKLGYRFTGWYCNGRSYSDRETVYITVTKEESARFYAQWEKLPDNRVTFHINGGTSLLTDNMCIYNDRTVSYTAGTTYRIEYGADKTGKTFLGWATSSKGSPIYPKRCKKLLFTKRKNGRVV